MKQSLKIFFHLFVASIFSLAHAGAYEDFYRAISIDDDGTVRSLLSRGFDPNGLSEKGQTGLILAFQSQAPKVASALLAHPGLQVDAPNQAGETALMIAALHGERAWADDLIRRGAAVNRTGWSPLHYAASGPSTALVERLLALGAEIEAKSPNGSTPLMMAARYGAIDSAIVLLARGANPKARNERGLTAADFARSAGRDELAGRLDAASR